MPVAVSRGLARRAISASVLLSVLFVGTASAASVADITALMRSGKQAEAMTQLEAGLKKDPQDPQLRFAKGVIFTEQKRTQEAIAIFLKLSEEFPNLPEPYNNLAVLYSQENQFDKARAALNMAIKTNASYATAYENLGDVHARMAAQAYDKALNLNSNGDVKSKLAVLHTLGIPEPTKVAAVTPAATVQGNAPVASAVPIPVSTPSGAPAVLEKRPGASKDAVAAAIAAARQAAAEKSAAQTAATPATAPVPATAQAPAPAPAPKVAVATAATVPAPAPVAPVTAAAAPRPMQPPVVAKPVPVVSEQETVLAAISTWSRAWAGKDMDGYLSAYAPGFKGASKSPAAWAAERKVRIMGKSSIQHTVEQPTVEVQGDTATAKFRQIYVGGAVQSDGMKTLSLRKYAGKWQITNEISTD